MGGLPCDKGEGSDECDDGRQHQMVDGEAEVGLYKVPIAHSVDQLYYLVT